MKKVLVRVICAILLITYLATVCFANETQTETNLHAILGQFSFENVPARVGNLTDFETGFVYNDGLLFLDNSTLSPELAKASVVLSSAAYSWDNLKDALS